MGARSHHERGQLFGIARDGSTWIEPELPYHEATPLTSTSGPVPGRDHPWRVPRFDPDDCGGVFDGFGNVTSDADPGL